MSTKKKKKPIADSNSGDPEAQRVEEEYEKNIATVMFTPATTKKVCSPHSGSILGAEGRIVPLNDEQNERIAKIFDSDVVIKQGEMKKLLIESFGYKSYDGMEAVIQKVYGDSYSASRELTQDDFTDFLSIFQNPAYYYGQRLRRSAGRGLVDETREIIIRGCDPNTADGEGLNALHYAAEFNCVAIIREIAKLTSPFKGLLILDARCKYGWTPLYCAAHHGNIDCVELLLKLGADPSIANHVGKTPLHAAAAQGRSVIIDLIISSSSDANALMNQTDKHGMTPLHESAYKGQEKVFQHLSKICPNSVHTTDVMENQPGDYFNKIRVMH